MATAPDETSELDAHLERLHKLRAVRRRLSGSTSVGALFAEAATIACDELGFDRAVVLAAERGTLTAGVSDALARDASDRLRRRVLAEPVSVGPETYEAELIRQSRLPATRRAPSRLAEALELSEYVIAPVAPEARTLALLVADRQAPPVHELEAAGATLLADLLAGALERLVLRLRQRELATDLQHLTASTQALMREMLESPVALPLEGQRPAFPLSGPIGVVSEDRLREILSEGEARIAALLVQGRSNREIADELILSPETVKATVARILRKLGASNRVEAVAMILRMLSPAG
jgi:DNA-binding NarL/FixJ family response regulator